MDTRARAILFSAVAAMGMACAAGLPAAEAHSFRDSTLSGLLADYQNFATFDYPERLDGYAGWQSCAIINRPHLDYRDLDTGLYPKPHIGLHHDVGSTMVLYGSQTPQHITVCKYADRTYYHDTHGTLGFGCPSSAGRGIDPFTGYHTSDWNTPCAVSPVPTNPYEPVQRYGHLYESIRKDAGIHVVVGDTVHHIVLEGIHAIVAEAEFLPMDDRLRIKAYGITGTDPSMRIYMPPDLASFDADGDVVVRASRDGASDVLFVTDTSNSRIASDHWFYEDYEEVTIAINMAEHGWPLLGGRQLYDASEAMYLELYEDEFMEEHGRLPDFDFVYDRYIDRSSNRVDDVALVSYRDVTLDLEIPLIVHNKESLYGKSHPEIGWCKESHVLVARAPSPSDVVPKAACVSPDTVGELVRRGWAQEGFGISQKMQDAIVGPSHGTWKSSWNLFFGYEYGAKSDLDSFKAALLGKMHPDDVTVIETIKPSPDRLEDLLEHDVGHDEMSEMLKGYPICKSKSSSDTYIWNSDIPPTPELVRAHPCSGKAWVTDSMTVTENGTVYR